MKDELFARFIAYMNQVVYRARIDYLRKAKQTHENEVMAGNMPDVPVYDDQEQNCASLDQLSSHPEMAHALCALDDKDQKVIFLLFCRQYNIVEAAKAMDLSKTSICRIRDRALEKLRKDMRGGDTNA